MTSALTILLQQAELDRDQVAASLQLAQAQSQALQRQGEQLSGYQAETQSRDPTREGRSAAIGALVGHHSFVTRLRQARSLLQSQLDHADLRVQALRVDLLSAETRLAQLRKLHERRQHSEHLLQERQDHRRNDDAAQQRLAHAKASAGAQQAAFSGEPY